MKAHVTEVCQSAAQSLYALKVLKNFGLDEDSIHLVCSATVAARLTYAIPAWWGFATVDDKQVLQACLNKARKWGFYAPSLPSIELLCSMREDKYCYFTALSITNIPSFTNFYRQPIPILMI